MSEPRKDVLVAAHVNVYAQEGKPLRSSRPHATRAHADRGAERVWRATGGACVRVRVDVKTVEKGLLVEVC